MNTTHSHRGLRFALLAFSLLALLPAGNYVYQSARIANVAIKSDLSGKARIANLGYQILLARYPLSPLAPVVRLRLEAGPGTGARGESRMTGVAARSAALPMFEDIDARVLQVDQFGPVGFLAASALMIVGGMARRLGGSRRPAFQMGMIVGPGLLAGGAVITSLIWLRHPSVEGIWQELPAKLLSPLNGSILSGLWGLLATITLLVCLLRFAGAFVARCPVNPGASDYPPPLPAAG